MVEFSNKILKWHKQYGRHNLPWQSPRTPYFVWLSEIMLQQTQVVTVIPYFKRFISKFPTVQDLAQANIDEVLGLWAGLGYYARARNLHKAAQQLSGGFPTKVADWEKISGVGRSTAAAIVSQSYNEPLAILDGNVKRVLSRCFNIEGHTTKKDVEDKLWQQAELLVPKSSGANYSQAIMDLGATICKRSKPLCLACPVSTQCEALRLNKVASLPTKKAKKQIPKKEKYFAIISCQQEILLEKRPPTGIWGGLWSLPEFNTKEEMLSFLNEKNLVIDNINKMIEPLFHRFTHFELELKPIIVTTKFNINSNKKVMESDMLVWYKYNSIPKGLATPINKILKRL